MINDSDNGKRMNTKTRTTEEASEPRPPRPKAEASDAKRRENRDDNDDEHDWRNDDCKDDGETMTMKIDMTMVIDDDCETTTVRVVIASRYPRFSARQGTRWSVGSVWML